MIISNLTRIGISRPCGAWQNNLTCFRFFASTVYCHATQKHDKFYKLLKYTRKVDETEYTIGQDHPSGLRIPAEVPNYPKYKYEARFFKRQNKGLYGGLQRSSGTTCSEFLNKTRRARTPNIRRAKLWSEILNKKVNLRVSTRVLRTLTKEGGLDEYLLKSTPARMKTMGLMGWKLRYQLLQQLEAKNRGSVELKDGKTVPITYIHPDGRKFIVPKEQLLNKLYEMVQRDSYYPVLPNQFNKNYSWMSFEEIVNRLDSHQVELEQFTM
ncbi:hypothetical protein KGF56_001955 [Candida oxycetoniae]|uniref:54S ribosomal protein L24, mitochondrial n=1 Tax=Candida oxycetoniae TaxID=497107 RepID=A0AAI9SY37_9ASCO|nr:uncharacterized protein KGF56_001955 [Candida oxycetoniae]KAI3405240.2 hypothetical protein KGF56_001955 [Candida oxycetoniae]